MIFYLGTHRPTWLEQLDVPLFVSHRVLAGRRRLPRAIAPWALDSGGFSELSMFGEWRTTPREYVAAVRRYREEIGGLEWAAPQDWMCEPFMLKRTGLSVIAHQQRTVRNYLLLREHGHELPFIPVLQGWSETDYMRCWELYLANGVNLALQPLVGVGSVCRRQSSAEITEIMVALQPLRLHGFGVKIDGLRRYGSLLESADSMAWSAWARRDGRMLAECTHKTCTNCSRWALHWRDRITRGLSMQQMLLPACEAARG